MRFARTSTWYLDNASERARHRRGCPCSGVSGPITPAHVPARRQRYLTPAIEDRAGEILTLLTDRGQHRAASVPDLIIAATAELARLTVLHLDKDFDVIAGITGQPIERLKDAVTQARSA